MSFEKDTLQNINPYPDNFQWEYCPPVSGVVIAGLQNDIKWIVEEGEYHNPMQMFDSATVFLSSCNNELSIPSKMMCMTVCYDLQGAFFR